MNTFLFKEILRVLISLIFIGGAILKLYPIAPLEIFLVKLNIGNWYWAPVIARLIIGFEIALGSFLLLRIYLKQTLIVSLITLVGFSLFLFYIKFILGKDYNCGCFGEAIQFNPIESLLKNIILICFTVFLILKHKTTSFFQNKYQKIILVIALTTSFSLPFILNAISLSKEGNYVIKPGMAITPDKFQGITFNGDSVNLLEGRKLICFLSLKCRTCKHAAAKLAVFNKQHNDTLPIFIIFLDTQDKEILLSQFMKETEAHNLSYTFMKAEQFMKVSDASLPFIMYLDNGQIKNLSNFDDMHPDAIIDFFFKENS